MSEFMDRARAEAEGRWSVIALGREQATRCRNAFADGAGWAAHQRPTDEELDAVARAMFTAELAPGGVAYESDWNDPDLRRYWQDAARAALRAAQKVRAGQ